MKTLHLTIFANFFIDTNERLLRLQSSYNSMAEINADRFVVNIRGRYAGEGAAFLKEKVKNIDLFSIESDEGWFYDTAKLKKFIHSKYILLWVEDHICMKPEKVNLITGDMNENDIDILTYSFWCNGAMLKRYSNIQQKVASEITFFNHTIHNNNLVQNNAINWPTYIIAITSIIKKTLFEKIINDGGSSNRWDKMTPFDFEKSPDDINWLPLKRGVPKYEIFASVDDDLNAEGSSLQKRGLYPLREGRKSFASSPRKNILLRIILLIRKTIRIFIRWGKILLNIILTPVGFRWDYAKSFLKIGKLVKPIPWMNYKVIRHIETKLTNVTNIFEYGSGTSTQYWLDKGKHVVSIEHSHEFYNVTKKCLLGDIDYKLVEPEIQNVDQVYNPSLYMNYQSKRFKGYNFEKYVKSIERYDNEFFDVIVVNGRARASCMYHSIPKLKFGGMLILENSDREHYLNDIKKMLDKWDKYTFRGSVRGLAQQEQTTIFVKPI
jgi:hypothetical protein